MNQNQTKGVGKVVTGSLKEAAGKATGQKTREMEGKIEKGVGKAQTKIGEKQEEHRLKKDSRR